MVRVEGWGGSPDAGLKRREMTFPELGTWISQWKEGKKKERGRELTAISQCMIQHYELEDTDFGELLKKMKEIAIQEMKHADAFAERIRFLKGDLPGYPHWLLKEQTSSPSGGKPSARGLKEFRYFLDGTEFAAHRTNIALFGHAGFA